MIENFSSFRTKLDKVSSIVTSSKTSAIVGVRGKIKKLSGKLTSYENLTADEKKRLHWLKPGDIHVSNGSLIVSTIDGDKSYYINIALLKQLLDANLLKDDADGNGTVNTEVLCHFGETSIEVENEPNVVSNAITEASINTMNKSQLKELLSQNNITFDSSANAETLRKLAIDELI